MEAIPTLNCDGDTSGHRILLSSYLMMKSFSWWGVKHVSCQIGKMCNYNNLGMWNWIVPSLGTIGVSGIRLDVAVRFRMFQDLRLA